MSSKFRIVRVYGWNCGERYVVEEHLFLWCWYRPRFPTYHRTIEDAEGEVAHLQHASRPDEVVRESP